MHVSRLVVLWMTTIQSAASLAISYVTNAACQNLSIEYPNQLYWPDSTQYVNETRSYYSQSTVLEPFCIFSPSDATEIASALRTLRSTQTQFAVRGNGHMPVKNAASTDSGVLIVLTKLREISLGHDSSVASLGPGLTWNIVYDFIQPYNRAILGGRYTAVGVSGLLLGGGVSHYSGKYGWAANSVVNFEVVTAGSNIINANATSNSDLFWALKGGSSNFGIITRFDVIAHPAPPLLYAGTVTYDENETSQLVSAFEAFVSPGGGIDNVDSAILPNILIDPAKGSKTSNVFVFNTANDTASLRNFTSIRSVSNTASIRKFNDALSESYALGAQRTYRDNFWATSLKASSRSVQILTETLSHVGTSQLQNVRGIQVVLSIQPISQNWMKAARKAGGDVIDLDPSDGNFIALNLYLRWSDSADDYRITQYVQEFLATVDNSSQAEGMFYPFLYLGDAAAGENPFATYGRGQSLNKMKAIRQRYDPDAVFQRLQPGGFKIGL